jgi:tetratricopeptide (TPR) repeat protein
MKKILIPLLFLVAILKTEAQSSVFVVVDSLLIKGTYQKALQLLENENDQNTLVLEKTADIYQTIGNYNKAIACYSEALEIEEKSQLKIKLANVYATIGYKDKAIDLYEDVFKKDSSNLLVANNLGKLYLRELKPKRAEQLFRYLKVQDTLNPNYPYQLGKALALQRKKLQMGQSYIDAFTIDTLHLNSIYEVAKFFKSLHIRDTSRMFIEKGLKIDATNINFLQLKANDHYFEKEFKEALVTLKKLEALKFRSINTYEMFGMSYFNLEQIDSAEIYFKKALKMDRKNPKILYRLATLEYQRENFKSARLLTMQSIMYSKPDHDKQYMLLGIMAKNELDYKSAVNYFDEAVKNNRSNADALFELAFAADSYYEDKKIALKHYERFIERFKSKNPKLTKYASERIKQLRKQLFIEGVIVD